MRVGWKLRLKYRFAAATLLLLCLPGLAQQIAGKGETGPAGSVVGYNASAPNWLYVPVDSNGYLMVDCMTGCNGGPGTFPTAAAAGQSLISTGAGTTYTAQYAGNVSAQVLYVAATGNNSNTGSSWQAAKLTIAAAVAALPVSGTLGSGGHHYGTIYVGPGNFVEAGNLEFNQSIAYIGTQAGILGASGTTVELANGANVPLFSYTSDWAASQQYSHDVVIKDMDLNGNSANNSAGNLVDLFFGGYNTKIDNVSFQFAAGYGLYINGKAVDFACYSCTFGGDVGGAVYVNETGGGSVVTFTDTQLDNDSPSAIVIDQGTFNVASSFVFTNLKAESSVSGQHNHVINHISGSNFITGDQITINGGYGYCAASTCDSFAYDNPGTGSEARWKIQNLICGEGYTSCFHSQKSGDTFDNAIVINDYSSNDRSTEGLTQTSPDFGVSGGAGLWGYPGNPNGVIPSNPGSILQDTTDGYLWAKVSGTGNTGWSQLETVGPVATIASASTIAPVTPLVIISGTATISTITLPAGFTSGCKDILASGAWSTTTGGNISTTLTASSGTQYRACYFGSSWTVK